MTRYRDKSAESDASDRNNEAYSKGCDYYAKQEYGQAKLSFEQAVEFWSEDARSWFALGNCHDAMNQPSRAEVCYLMSLKYSPEEAQPNVYFNLGNSLFDQAKYQQAVDCYEKIDDHNKAYTAAQKNLKLAKQRLS